MVRLLRSSRAIRSLSMGVFVLACAWPALAQETPPDVQAPAHISLVDGVAVLERDGQVDDKPGSMPLLAGDRIRTRSGRVEVLYADGSTLHLDHNTVIDLQSDELLRLVQGRIRLSIPGPERTVSYRIDGPHGWAQIFEPGDYRVALMQNAGGGELELAVIRGRAELANEDGQTPLRAGERAFVRTGAAPSYAYIANSAAMDAFDRWSENRRDERLSASAEYLPSEVRPYAASFERHGYWRDEPSYGRVWYPRVAVDWRPYYRGRWVSLRPYGWTWIPYDPWGWPTHHYGRWGVSHSGAWFWIPGRSWGAAWVSWAYAPDYVSWCPLGFNNRPVFHININAGNHFYNPWRAWTVVHRRHFGFGYVHRNFVRVSHLDRHTLSAFAPRDRAPEIVGQAVPRASAPIRVAGTRPRPGSTPLYTNLPADRGRVQSDGSRIRIPNASPTAPPDSANADGQRERAVPSRPAVRSERSLESDERRAVGARPNSGARRIATPGTDLRRAETPNSGVRRVEPPTSSRSVESPGARRRVDVPSVAPQGAPSRSNGPGVAVPRTDSPANRGADQPTDRRYDPAPDRRQPVSPRSAEAPRAVESPSYRRPAEVPQQRPQYGNDRPSRSYEAAPGAAPRGDDGRPAGGAQQAAPSRGADRAPSGSIERRSPAGAQPSARPGGGGSGGAAGQPSARPGPGSGGASQPSGPPRGARPRPGGGGR